VELEHFKLNNSEEVKLFCERLDNFQKSKVGVALPYIDLNVAFEKLQGFSEGGRLFTALLDLKLNFVMLNIDSMKASGIWNQYFSTGKLVGGSVLDNQLKFNGKSEMQYYQGNFIPRYRAIWDKLLGILILMFMPDSYEKFRRAKSRKKEFEKLCKEIPQIPEEFVKNVIKGIADFDQSFRTPEIHGTGTLRKWNFTMLASHETPLREFGNYWNWLLPILSELDKVIKAMIVNEE
jgi:hypothetical protein